MTHGTHTAYNNHGCRCRPCKDARAEYMRNRKPQRKCEIEGCDWPHCARGFCRRHWRAWKLYGDPLAVRPWGQSDCTFPGCSLSYLASGLCVVHYGRARRLRDDPKLSDKGPVFLELAPFLPVVEQLVLRYGTTSTAEREIGLSKGHLHNIVSGRNKAIHIDLADQLCLFAGVPFTDDIVVPFKQRGRAAASGEVRSGSGPTLEAAS